MITNEVGLPPHYQLVLFEVFGLLVVNLLILWLVSWRQKQKIVAAVQGIINIYNERREERAQALKEKFANEADEGKAAAFVEAVLAKEGQCLKHLIDFAILKQPGQLSEFYQTFIETCSHYADGPTGSKLQKIAARADEITETVEDNEDEVVDEALEGNQASVVDEASEAAKSDDPSTEILEPDAEEVEITTIEKTQAEHEDIAAQVDEPTEILTETAAATGEQVIDEPEGAEKVPQSSDNKVYLDESIIGQSETNKPNDNKEQASSGS